MPGTDEAAIALAAHREEFRAAMRADRRYRLAMLCGWPLTDRILLPCQLFRGTGDQVRAARRFVRASSAGHPATANAVLVDSELAANAVAHSVSGHTGGRFMVHLANFGTESLIVMVTDQGGPGRPHMVDAGADAESGRGLAVIEALTTFLTWFDNDPLRSVLAVVPPEPSGIRATPQASTAAAIRLVTWGGAPASCSLVWHAPACVP